MITPCFHTSLRSTCYSLLLGMLICIAFSHLAVAQSSLPDTRVFRSYHAEGILEMKYEYYFDFWSEKPVLHGAWGLWWKDGRLRESREYQEGELHGTVQRFRRNGELWRSVEYQEGLRSGVMEKYDRQGTLRVSAPYQAGQKSGLLKIYDRRGRLRKVVTYYQGKRQGPVQVFRPDGSIKRERIQ